MLKLPYELILHLVSKTVIFVQGQREKSIVVRERKLFK